MAEWKYTITGIRLVKRVVSEHFKIQLKVKKQRLSGAFLEKEDEFWMNAYQVKETLYDKLSWLFERPGRDEDLNNKDIYISSSYEFKANAELHYNALLNRIKKYKESNVEEIVFKEDTFS